MGAHRDLPSFRTFAAFTVLLIINEILSYAAYVNRDFGVAVFFVAVFLFSLLTFHRLENGLLILLIELFIGGKGYLYSIHIGTFAVSIRVALFTVVMVVWALKHRRAFDWTRLPGPLRTLIPLFGIVIVWGVLNGILSGHGTMNVYYDANAYLFLTLIIVLLSPTIDWSRFRRLILAAFAASAAVLGIKSLVTLGLFTHFGFAELTSMYRWIRNTGVGEIAPIGHASVRVFFQSQVYGLLAFLTLAPYLAQRDDAQRRPWWLVLPLTLGISAVIVSLSRSFWLGGIVALVVGMSFAVRRFAWSLRKTLAVVGFVCAVLAGGYVLTSWAMNFPSPFPTAASESLLAKRLTGFKGEPAASSRLQMLPPLMQQIAKRPILGSGFGQTVTYQSSDPRQTSSKNKGVYTTDTFELGYLDIALKVGFVGLVLYLAIIGKIFTGLAKTPTVLAVGMVTGLAALIVIHATTPYLNHPLGIGFMLLALTLGHMRPASIPNMT